MESNNNKSGRVVSKKKAKKQSLRTFVTSLLRRGSFYWKPRSEAMTKARVSRGLYRCAMCEETFKPKEVIIDHIEPVVDPKTGFVGWDDYIQKLLCPVEGFQILCRACSDSKTRIEDEMREHFKTCKEELPDFKHKRKKEDLLEEDEKPLDKLKKE